MYLRMSFGAFWKEINHRLGGINHWFIPPPRGRKARETRDNRKRPLCMRETCGYRRYGTLVTFCDLLYYGVRVYFSFHIFLNYLGMVSALSSRILSRGRNRLSHHSGYGTRAIIIPGHEVPGWCRARYGYIAGLVR